MSYVGRDIAHANLRRHQDKKRRENIVFGVAFTFAVLILLFWTLQPITAVYARIVQAIQGV